MGTLFITRLPKCFFMCILLTFCSLLVEPQSIFAKSFQFTNNSKKAITLSDLTVYPESGGGQVVLVGHDATDDIIVKPGKSTVKNTDKDGNPLIEWVRYELSTTTDDSEAILRTRTNLNNIMLFTPNTEVLDLYYSICPALPNGLEEDQVLSVVNGVDGNYPELFFSTTPFTYGDDCNMTGQTGFTGDILVLGPATITTIIPTVSEWGLIIMTGLLLVFGAIVIRRRLRTVSA